MKLSFVDDDFDAVDAGAAVDAHGHAHAPCKSQPGGSVKKAAPHRKAAPQRMAAKKRNLFVVQKEHEPEAVVEAEQGESDDESATLEWEAAQMRKVLGTAARVDRAASDGQLGDCAMPDYDTVLASVMAQHDRLAEQVSRFEQQIEGCRSSILQRQKVEAVVDEERQHVHYLQLLLDRYHAGEDVEVLEAEWGAKYPKDPKR